MSSISGSDAILRISSFVRIPLPPRDPVRRKPLLQATGRYAFGRTGILRISRSPSYQARSVWRYASSCRSIALGNRSSRVAA